MYMRCGIGRMSFKLDRIDAGVDATTHRGHGGKGGGVIGFGDNVISDILTPCTMFNEFIMYNCR